MNNEFEITLWDSESRRQRTEGTARDPEYLPKTRRPKFPTSEFDDLTEEEWEAFDHYCDAKEEERHGI